MSFDKLIYAQVQEALQPVMTDLRLYVETFAKVTEYKEVRVGAAEAARLLGRSVRMIHIYVDEGVLKPVDPHEKCKHFTLEEIDRFKSKTLAQRRVTGN
ncbi:hypothetical protein [Caedibacter taeniospiralis]|jgi:hypothetical protein|uniref:hypothetical protein n=1 Tax=Caedibacter taeniospiralis TaxID=28907 RepID=UPI0037BEC6B0